MLRKSLLSFVAVAAVASAAFAQAANPTVDELIEKNIQAKGGREKLKAVQTRRLTGKMLVGPGLEAPFVLEQARPNKMRMEFVIQGMTAVTSYDGTAGWQLMPFLGKKEAEQMSADDLKQAQDQAEFDGSFVDYKDKGNQVELVGKEEVEGTPAYKLKVTKKSGDTEIVYLDADSFLEIQSEGKNMVRGQEVETVTSIGDYKEVQGVLFPFSIQSKPKGAAAGQGSFVMTVEKVEVNPQLAADRFGKPEGAPAPAPAKPQQ